jgi:hypothetical protein
MDVLMNKEEVPLSKRDFDRALGDLLKQARANNASPGSYKSEECVRCYDCMFTQSSTDCFKCTYCTHCESCSDCTHCHNSTNCHSSSYCQHAVNCNKSSYLIHCSNCYECVFCFGCVGLVKKEFHILNHPFPRNTYFKLVAELKEALGLS